MAELKKILEKARMRLLDLQPTALKDRQATVVREQPSCRQLFYTFQGRGMRIMMHPMEFLRETGLIRRNLVMLRDHAGFFYHAGLSEEIPSFEATLEWLEKHRAERSFIRETYCLGSSAGGYAAILFGHYLKADRVYAFAPQTEIDLEVLARMTGRDDTSRIPEPHRDLRLLLGEGNGHTKYEIYFSEDHATDRRFAEQISGCPNVTIHPQPGEVHGVVHTMHEAGNLASIFPAQA